MKIEREIADITKLGFYIGEIEYYFRYNHPVEFEYYFQCAEEIHEKLQDLNFEFSDEYPDETKALMDKYKIVDFDEVNIDWNYILKSNHITKEFIYGYIVNLAAQRELLRSCRDQLDKEICNLRTKVSDII